MPHSYRKPTVYDATLISDCIRASTTAFKASASVEAADDWNDVSGSEAITNRILNGDLSLVAVAENKVNGFISYRNTNHLSLLFVRSTHQSMGIGRTLIDSTRPLFESVTLNSTEAAVGFYQRMGFEVVGERFLKRGVYSTPMAWHISSV